MPRLEFVDPPQVPQGPEIGNLARHTGCRVEEDGLEHVELLLDVLTHGDPAGVVNGRRKRRPARERVDVDSALVEFDHEVVQAPKPSLAAVFVGGSEDLP